ncbi:unnamed protein product [Candida verbasci]|uniref:ADP-ribosylation factor GTPase-activating protein n=1 Tax=Candida verbasci TaxID=1227364 RepID=A0A9W4TW00_9ASCO|nr:unnamed protein product [Candida verbasci]
MDAISKLSFPYYQNKDQLVLSLNKLTLTDENDTNRFIITLNNQFKSIESIEQINTQQQQQQATKSVPVQYIQNINQEQSTQFPLLIKINPLFYKLKFHISLKPGLINFNSKSLIIVKTTKDLSFVKDNISQNIKELEVSKIEYVNLPIDKENETFQKVIINDYYNSSNINNNNLNVSLWEYDSEKDNYHYLLNFSLFVDKLNKTEEIPEKHEKLFTLGDFKKEFYFNIEDGPELRKTFNDLENIAPKVKRIYLQLSDDFKIIESSIRRISHTKFMILEGVNSLMDCESNYLLNEMKFKQSFHQSFLKLFENFEKNLNFFFTEVCDSKFLTKILNQISSLDSEESKKQFENDSKEYYSWLNKYLSNEKERPESKLLNKRKIFELSKFDYLNQLTKFTNNQYINELTENLFKFVKLDYKHGLLNTSLYKNKKMNQLIENNYQIYLNVLLRFNSEKYKFRQMIEACATNEELTKLISYNKLNSSILSINEFIITNDNSDLLFSNEIPQFLNIDDSEISGILFTLGGQKKQGWHKEWVVVKNGQLIEFSDWRKGKTPINKPIEVSLSNIKPISYDKRQYCFEITTSTNSKHVFQAINNDDRNKWLKALYNAGQLVNTERIEKQHKKPGKLITNFEKPNILKQDRSVSPISIKSKLPTPIEEKDYLSLVKDLPDTNNNICVDCGATESVEWISLSNLACFCVNCSSCHRTIGSRVRSLKLDHFENEVELLLKLINNKLVNSVLEEKLTVKIKSNEPNESRLQFIKDKYIHKKFIEPIPDVNNLLIKSIQSINLPNVLTYILAGADVNLSIQITSSNINNQIVDLFEYSLRKYVELEKTGQKLFLISELLILNDCEIKDPKKTNKELDLSNEAINYWTYRYQKLNGT